MRTQLGLYCCVVSIALVMRWKKPRRTRTQTVSEGPRYLSFLWLWRIRGSLRLSLSFLSVSYGGRDHSRITPNTSLGLISATPSRALPSPTVNTREALGKHT